MNNKISNKINDINIVSFKKAKPVWIKNKSLEMNVQAGFVAEFVCNKQLNYILKLTGATFYRIFINGEFIHYGPARAPHGYARVDEINLTSKLNDGVNVISIEVAGYNVYSYYSVFQPSFIQAEIEENGNVIAATEENGNFNAKILDARIQKSMRYSFQRHFSENYIYQSEGSVYNWMTDFNDKCGIL